MYQLTFTLNDLMTREIPIVPDLLYQHVVYFLIKAIRGCKRDKLIYGKGGTKIRKRRLCSILSFRCKVLLCDFM